jgi:hypothetical protein
MEARKQRERVIGRGQGIDTLHRHAPVTFLQLGRTSKSFYYLSIISSYYRSINGLILTLGQRPHNPIFNNHDLLNQLIDTYFIFF